MNLTKTTETKTTWAHQDHAIEHTDGNVWIFINNKLIDAFLTPLSQAVLNICHIAHEQGKKSITIKLPNEPEIEIPHVEMMVQVLSEILEVPNPKHKGKKVTIEINFDYEKPEPVYGIIGGYVVSDWCANMEKLPTDVQERIINILTPEK